MPDDLRTLQPAQPRGTAITVDLDGGPVRAYVGEPLAVALFASGVRLLARSPKYHRPRGLFCGTGQCGSCLMRVDGRPNVRSCMEPVHPDMRCERQNAFPDVEIDVLRAADWMFPGGMDHHQLMTGSRIANDLFVKLVRQMGGTGTLPDEPAESVPAPIDKEVEVAIVGAGPAGLSAARAILEARPGTRLLLVDDQPRPGGSWLAEPGGAAAAADAAKAVAERGGVLWDRAVALAVYPRETRSERPGDAAGLLAVARQGEQAALGRITARRFVYTTGAYDQNLPLPNNDRPGMLAARAVGRMAFVHGIRPGRRLVVLRPVDRSPAYLERLAQGLAARGVAVEMADAGHLPRLDLDKDVVAVGAGPAPASELPRQHGCRVRFDVDGGGFVVESGPDGAGARGVHVAGDVTGYMGPEAAAAAGERLGALVARNH